MSAEFFARQIAPLLEDPAQAGEVLRWHHFTPVYLPPYSPDDNAIERLWLHLKSQWFAGFIARNSTALMDRILLALTSLLQISQILKSQCRVNAHDF